MNLQSLLSEAQQAGVMFTLVNGRLHYKAPKGFLTVARRDLLEMHKAKLLALLRAEMNQPPVNETGKALLSPYLPVIQAAHRNELPAVSVCMGRQEYGLADYICRVSAGIWYGTALDDPLLPAWLENLRRFQAWYETPSLSKPAYEREDDGLCCYCRQAQAVYPQKAPNICEVCWQRREEILRRERQKCKQAESGAFAIV